MCQGPAYWSAPSTEEGLTAALLEGPGIGPDGGRVHPLPPSLREKDLPRTASRRTGGKGRRSLKETPKKGPGDPKKTLGKPLGRGVSPDPRKGGVPRGL